MTEKNTITLSLMSFSCTLAYFFIIFVNELFVAGYLRVQEVTFTTHDDIDFYKICGYITATVILLIFSRFFAYAKLLACCISVYFLALISIIFIDVSNSVMLFYFFAYSVSATIIMILLLGSSLRDQSFAAFAPSILVAYILSKLVYFFVPTIISEFGIIEFVALNAFPLIVFTMFLAKETDSSYQNNFFTVLKFMEFEALAGFCIFYVIMVISNGYEVYSLTESFALLDAESTEYLFVASLIGAFVFTIFYSNNLNKYKAGVSAVFMLAILFASMPYWGVDGMLLLGCWFVIGVLLYAFMTSSILSLAEKFEDNNALSIYALFCSLGYYCGYITIDKSENTLGDSGFLISISFVLIGLLVYYLFLFTKNKLYR